MGSTATAGDILETFTGGVINTENGTTVQWSDSGNAAWRPDVSGLLIGDHWESGDIFHNEISRLTLTVDIDTGGGQLYLDYALFSESSWDFFVLEVNTIPVFSDSGFDSGSLGPFALPAGVNVIEFEYDKDGSVSVGTDAAAIDNVRVTNVVPAPGAFALAALGGLAGVRRRR